MSLEELTVLIVKSLVSDPESVSSKAFDEDDSLVIEVMVPENDAKNVIGKEGKIANSIRTIVQASSFLKENKKVKININVF